MAESRLPPEFEKLARTEEPFLRRLALAGLLTKCLPTPPVLVGEYAVEFYTLCSYATGGMDLLHPSAKAVGDLLESWGFEREGRHWVHRGLDLYVEVPADRLEGADLNRVTRVEVEGLPVDIIGLEDLIADRLNAAVHWRSEDDQYWASEMIRTHLEKLDWDYLRRRCQEEGTRPVLQELEERARGGPH